MKKGNFIFKVAMLAMAVVFGLTAKTNVLKVEAANHSQAEAVNWATSQIGKGLDYDGVYGNQCVDLIKYYYAYLGCANYATGNASAYATNTLPSGWTRVYSNFQPGDIAVWKTNHSCSTCGTSSLGHVGIITSADSVGFNAVNQNHLEVKHCTQNWFYCSALQCAIRPNFNSTPAPTPSIATAWAGSASDITYTNAKVSATVSTSESVQFQRAGCNIYNSSGTLIAQAAENTSVKGYYMNIWYDISAETSNHIQLTPGTTYQYRFFTTFGGKDYYSPTYTFTTKKQETVNPAPTPQPAAPVDYTPAKTKVTKVANSGTALKLTWDKVNNATGYYIYKRVNTDSYKIFKTVTGNATVSTTDSNVINGNKYSYKIISYRTVSGKTYKSDYSNVGTYYYMAKCNFKSLTNKFYHIAKLAWAKNGKATGYQIQYATKSDFSNYKSITVKGASSIGKNIYSLSKGKTYYVRIRSYKTVSGKNYYSGWTKKSVKITQ